MSEDSNQNRNKSLENAVRKIISIFSKQDVNQITIQRKYLPEIFDSDLLEISKSDGLPTVKAIALNYFLKNEIITNIYDYEVQFIKGNITERKKQISIPNINPHQITKTTQTLVKQAIQKKQERKIVVPVSETKEVELDKDPET